MSKFLKIIVNIFLICAILVAAAILIPPVAGITTTIVDTESMDTNLPMGSITYSKDINAANLQPGNEVLKQSDTQTYAYIIQSGDAASGKFEVLNATDKSASAEEITLRNNVSKVIITVPYIGYVVVAMHSMEGIIIIALVVLFMIILFILSELWKKTPEDDDEEEEEQSSGKKARKAEKAAAKEAARSAKLKASGKEDAADAAVGAVQAGMAAAEPDSGVMKESPAEEEDTAASISRIMRETKENENAAEDTEEENQGSVQTTPDGPVTETAAEAPAAAEPQPAAPEKPEASETPAPEKPGASAKQELPQEPAAPFIQEAPAAAEMPAKPLQPFEDAAEETAPEAPAETAPAENFVPVPRPTLDEIMDQAEEAGEEPAVLKDPNTGITTVDFSPFL